MQIKYDKTKYHRFSFTYAYNPEVLEFCRLLKDSFGWVKFSFDGTTSDKKWVFSDAIFVSSIQKMFPDVIIDDQVRQVLQNDRTIYLAQKNQHEIINDVKRKKTTNFVVDGIKGELYEYQKVGVEFLVASKGRALIADEPGCISGDMVIVINRGGCAKKYTLRDLYKKFNNWNKETQTRTRSLNNNGLFELNEIKNVLYMGVKKVFEVNAINDEGIEYTIKATPDHRIATQNGWVELGDLKIGETIIVNGDILRFCDICKKETPHALSEYIKKYRPKNYGKCKKCIYRFFRNNHSGILGKNEHLDKNGYVYVSNTYFHPRFLASRKKNKAIFKHILVYEAFKNDLSYDEWLEMCSKNKIPDGSFFVDSSEFSIHHKNRDKQDNRITNLEYVTHRQHASEHRDEIMRNLKFNIVPSEAKITSIKELGDTDVYDIQMKGIYKNFISNGVVVHNCGKTLQAIAYAQHQSFKRCLVICPASVKAAWESEIEKWTDMSSIVIGSKTKIQNISPDVNIWIINYDQLKNHLKDLSNIQFDLIIGDEVHLIKSVSAKRTRAFRMLSSKIPHVVLLTGTPMTSRPKELYPLLNIIDPYTWNNYHKFSRRYCGTKEQRFQGATNTGELHSKINKYYIRRTKDVLDELPEKNRIEVPVILPHEFQKQYETAEFDFAEHMKRYTDKNPEEIAKALQVEKFLKINILRSVVANGEIETARDLIDSIIDADEKIIVFCSFTEPLKKLKQIYGETAVILTGETKAEDRGDIVKEFQTNNKVKVFLGGFRSAGAGITLTAATNTLFIGFPWNPSDIEQAENRNHRPGIKSKHVNIYQLYVKGTIDKFQKELIARKQRIIDKVIDGEDYQYVERNSIDEVAKLVADKYR